MPKVIQISDCHLFADPQKLGYGGINPYLCLQELLSQAGAEKPDTVVFTGDLSGDDSAEGYRLLTRMVKDYLNGVDVRIIPGNHDDLEQMRNVLPENWLWLDRVESKFGRQFIYLNTQYEGTKGNLTDSQLAFLKQKLDMQESPALIFVHHHPITSESFMDKHHWINRDIFMDVLRNANRPITVLHGHIHHASHKQVASVKVLSCPSTCWQWKMSEEFGVTDELPGYRVININNQDFDTHIVRLTRRI